MKSWTKFSLGQVVRLKSGGPKMVVGHLSARGEVVCFWHKADGSVNSYEFSAFMLEAEGDEAREIVVTKEMAEAGLTAWMESDSKFHRSTELLETIYRAMWKAK